ncbi:hypothetical protein ACN47E_001835 [Coniothyrium glycines]
MEQGVAYPADSVSSISTGLDKYALDDLPEDGEESHLIGLSILQGQFRTLLGCCDIRRLGHFFGKTWFRRVWVVQEVVLAKQVVLHAGRNTLSFNKFASAVFALWSHKHFFQLRTSDVSDTFLHNLNTVNQIVDARYIHLRRNRLGKPRVVRTLYEWCRMLVYRECSDERDKVYAALGLASGDITLLPDYKLSLTEILSDLTAKSLASGQVSILHYAQNLTDVSTSSSSPSYVARITRAEPGTRPYPLGGTGMKHYQTGLSRRFYMTILNSSLISILGTSIDKVIHVKDIGRELCEYALGTGSPFKMELQNAWDRIATAYTSASHITKHNAALLKLKFWRAIHLGLRVKDEHASYFEHVPDLRFLGQASRVAIAQALHVRSMFITERGFIGLGPPWTKVGDQAVVLHGAETPFLLRLSATATTDTQWKLVGDCYVEDWMQKDDLSRHVREMDDEGKCFYQAQDFVLS